MPQTLPVFVGGTSQSVRKHGGPGGLTTPMAIPSRHLCPGPPGGGRARLSLLGREQICHPFLSFPGRRGQAGGGSPPPGPASRVFTEPAEIHTAGQAVPAREQENKVSLGHRAAACRRLLPALLVDSHRPLPGDGLWAGNTFCPRDSVTSFLPSAKGRNADTRNRSPGLVNPLAVPGSLTASQHSHRYQRSRVTSGAFGKKEGREGTGGWGQGHLVPAEPWAATAAAAITPLLQNGNRTRGTCLSRGFRARRYQDRRHFLGLAPAPTCTPKLAWSVTL